MPNATCIYLYEGERAPVVFSTALLPREQVALDRWLDENPDLAGLVQRATELAQRELERGEPAAITGLQSPPLIVAELERIANGTRDTHTASRLRRLARDLNDREAGS